MTAFRCLPFLIVGVQACTAITLRPTYRPLPLASFDTLTAKPPDVVTVAAEEIARLGLTVRVGAPAEGYLETRWFDLRSRVSRPGVTNPDRTVRLRVWADLVTLLQTEVVVEATQRRSLDPSVPEREDEIVAPPGTPADSLGQALREAIKRRFGGLREPGPGSRKTP